MTDFQKYVAQTSDHSLEFEVSKAVGVKLYDESGKDYFDLHSGVGVMNLGHSNPVVTNFIRMQAERYTHTMVYGEHVQDAQVNYAKSLSFNIDLLDHTKTHAGDSGASKVFFTNSGNEAIDLAIKVAKKWTGRRGLVSLVGGFHGRGQGPLQVTWNKDYRDPFFVECRDTDFIDAFADDIEGELDKVEWSSKAAVFVELVQGEAGAKPLPRDFVVALRDRTLREGVLLVVDEVQTGFGRTGTLFAQEQYGVVGDVTCLGKAGGGGLPFGAVVSKPRIIETLLDPPLSHISTFGGNPVVCAAGEAVLSQLTEVKLESVRVAADYFEEKMNEMVQSRKDIFEDFRGLGFLRGLVLNPCVDVEKFYRLCVEKGLLLHFKLNSGSTLRVSPPIVITQQEIDVVMSRFASVLKEVETCLY